MTPLYCLQPDAYIRDWLIRVDTQYDKTTPEKVKTADSERARQTLESNAIYNFLFSSLPRGCFSSGDTTTNSPREGTYIHIHNNASAESSDSKTVKKKKKTEEEKTNWKGIAAIGFVSTAVAGISIFVYARLSKAAEGAVNYLENTKRVQQWAQISSHDGINKIACAQLENDQKVVNKITNYKYSMLTSLVGTLAIAGGGITILLASAPALATAGTTAVIVGGVLNVIAVMYAAHNCGMHWSDEEEGKKTLSEFKQLIPTLVKSFESDGLQSSFEGPQPSAPPPYDESQATYQAIHNQRAGIGIYPDLMQMHDLSGKKY